MIAVKFDSKTFMKEMDNIAKYAIGFLEGAERGRKHMMIAVGESTQELLEGYIDANARANPEILHHVYEWYQTGSPEARLFDIVVTPSVAGLQFDGEFRQSKSLKAGAKKPFYNKATVMEKGIPLTVQPREARVLAFEEDGKTVFTPNPVVIQNPGGSQVAGSFERIFDEFFNLYMTQSFLKVSGVKDRLENTKAFVDNIQRGKRMGKTAGNQAGFRWMTGRI